MRKKIDGDWNRQHVLFVTACHLFQLTLHYTCSREKYFFLHSATPTEEYLTIGPAAHKGYRLIAHEAKPHGLLTRGP